MSIPSKGSWNTAIKLNDRFYGIGYANGLFFLYFSDEFVSFYMQEKRLCFNHIKKERGSSYSLLNTRLSHVFEYIFVYTII